MQPNITLGLVGEKLTHSFSKSYFEHKFETEQLKQYQFENFELDSISEITGILNKHPYLKGFAVTVPYKESIIPFVDIVDVHAKKIGAINCVKILADKTLVGYNTDYIGFGKSLDNFLPQQPNIQALILGSGGSSKAVAYALQQRNISFTIVSRNISAEFLHYADLDKNIIEQHQLIINTTPIGMSPKEDVFPFLPYQYLNANHYLFDLIYNPAETLFLQKAREKGVHTKNGLEMLHIQAEENWLIWNS